VHFEQTYRGMMLEVPVNNAPYNVGSTLSIVRDRIAVSDGLRTRPEITSAFSISSSGRLWPFLNREILNVGSLRLRFRSIDHDQIQPKSERIPSEPISGRVLSTVINKYEDLEVDHADELT